MFDTKRKSGFTLVELLVVIIIISMLVGLAIPAVMMAQERARRMQCANNLRNLGGAIQEYELSKKQYPGWINQLGGGPASWPVMILKNIDRADIYDLWREGVTDVSPSEVHVSTFVCPSSDVKGLCPLSYVANCGQQDALFGSPNSNPPIPPDWAANGIFFRHYCPMGSAFVTVKIASTDITDGLQYTLLLSENLQAGNWANINEKTGERLPCTDGEITNGMVWWLSGTAGNYDTNAQELRINRGLDTITGVAKNYKDTRPSSYHPGGVNAVFADGHVQFLNEQMEYNVYAKIMATDDREAKFAGSNEKMRSSTNLQIEKLLQGKLSEDDLK